MKTDRVQRQGGLAPTKRYGLSVGEFLVSLAIIAILVALFLPTTMTPRDLPRRNQCRHQLKQIGIALHNYEEEYGSFPPAFTMDANGQPLHSWRTLILPYIDQKDLYEAIDLSKPWNDPANAKANEGRMPDYYACPSAGRPDNFHTTYQALVGPECAFMAEPQRIRDFTDGLTNVVVVAETPGTLAVHWMDPRDSAREFFLAPKKKETVLSHTGGFHVLFGDGSVRFLSENVSQETRRGLSTIAGEETLGEF